jgi:hypothetical protein
VIASGDSRGIDAGSLTFMRAGKPGVTEEYKIAADNPSMITSSKF